MARAQKGQQLRGGSRRLGLAAGPGRAVRGPGRRPCCSPLLARLQGEPHDSVAARRTVYEAVQAELDAEITRAGVDETLADFSRRRLRLIVRLLEQDIRAGVAVFVPGYMPARLEAEDQRLAQAHARREERRRQDAARDARRHASRHDIALEMELPRARPAT